MKTLLLLVLITISTMSFANAQDEQCERYNKFVDLTTKTIALTLNCKSHTNIRNDVDKLGKRLGFCRQAEDKGLGCTIISKAGVYVVNRQIPHYWLCKPDIAMKVLEMTLNKTCVHLTGL